MINKLWRKATGASRRVFYFFDLHFGLQCKLMRSDSKSALYLIFFLSFLVKAKLLINKHTQPSTRFRLMRKTIDKQKNCIKGEKWERSDVTIKCVLSSGFICLSLVFPITLTHIKKYFLEEKTLSAVLMTLTLNTFI